MKPSKPLRRRATNAELSRIERSIAEIKAYRKTAMRRGVKDAARFGCAVLPELEARRAALSA